MPKTENQGIQLKDLKKFTVPGLVLLFIIFSALFLVKPRIGEIGKNRKEIKKRQQKLSELTAKVASLESLDEAELVQRAEVVLKALPGEKNLPLLLLNLKSLAIENRLGFQIEVNPGELSTKSAEVKKEKLPFLSFKFQLFGQAADLKEFLTKLENVAPIMRAENLKVSVEGSDVFQSSLDLSSYFLPLPESIGVSEEPLSLLTPQEEEAYQDLSELEYLRDEESLPSLPSGKENPFASSLSEALEAQD